MVILDSQKILIFFSLHQKKNTDRIINALVEFGFPKSKLDADMFLEKGNIITFGVDPVRVDFINEIDGIKYNNAKKARIRGKYGNIDVFFIGREDLIINKQSTTRTKDKGDVEELL